MAKAYKVVLKANRYSSSGMDLVKPFETIVAEGAKELSIFMNDPAFECTMVEVPGPVYSEVTTSEGTSVPEDEVLGMSITKLSEHGVPKKVINKLLKKGLVTVGDVLDEEVSFDDLLYKFGLTESQANTLVSVCESLAGISGDDEDTQEDKEPEQSEDSEGDDTKEEQAE